MLRFFRVNDPLRIAVVMLIIFVIRLPYYIWGDVLTLSDVKLFSLGKMVSAGEWPYADIMTEIPPLAAWLFGLVYIIFGESLIALHVISVVLVCIQVILFNNLVNKNKATETQTYVPGFVYGILISINPDLFTLSPVMVAITLLLSALNLQFRHMEFRVKRDEKIFNLGLFIGAASLFFNPSITFLVMVLLVFTVFTRTVGRRYLLLLYGFFFPFLIVTSVYIMTGEANEFFNYSLKYQWYDADFKFDFNLPILVLLIFVIYAFTYMSRRVRFTNYQSTLNQVMFIWLLLTLVIWLFFNHTFSGVIGLLVVPISFFLMYLFVYIKPGFWSAIYLTLFIGLTVFSNWTYWWKFDNEFLNRNFQAIVENPYNEIIAGKEVMLLTNDIRYYHNAYPTTRFYNYDLTSETFANLNYENIALIDTELTDHKPDFIVDPENVLDKFVHHSAFLKGNYQWREKERIWQLVNN